METKNISRHSIMKDKKSVHWGNDRWDILIDRYDARTIATYVFDMKDLTGNGDHMLLSNSERNINKFMEYTGLQIHFIDE